MAYLGNGGSLGRSRAGSSTVIQERTVTLQPGDIVTLPSVRILGMSRISTLARRTAGAGGTVYLYIRQAREVRLLGQLVLTGNPDYMTFSIAGRDVYLVVSNVGGLGVVVVDTNLAAMGGA